jgi:hypothetical protein
VLLVRGDRKSGKTWSRHLFEQAAREQDARVTYLFEGTVGTVEEVFEKLFGLLQAPELLPETPDTSSVAWHRRVCRCLRQAAEKHGRRLWIAVDDLGPGPDGVTPLLDEEIKSFFDQFALELLDPAMHQWFRLLLIHYPDGPVPTRWEDELWSEDRTRPEDIDPAAVARVVREWLTDHNRQLPEDEVLNVAKQVVASAAQAPLERLPSIQSALMDKLRDLTGTPR